MNRKKARTYLSALKRTLPVTMSLLAFMAISCGGDKNEEPEKPQPGESVAIVGKWQKYQRVLPDGTLSEGDPDEFWIFEKNNDFSIEDGGDITDEGTYQTEGKNLIIKTYNVSDPREREELRGFYEIKDGFMNYQYTVVGENDYEEYRFRKIQ